MVWKTARLFHTRYSKFFVTEDIFPSIHINIYTPVHFSKHHSLSGSLEVVLGQPVLSHQYGQNEDPSEGQRKGCGISFLSHPKKYCGVQLQTPFTFILTSKLFQRCKRWGQGNSLWIFYFSPEIISCNVGFIRRSWGVHIVKWESFV